MTKLQVVERPAETPMSSARARLADAIAQRPGMTAEVAEIERQQRRLSSLVIAEKKAADTVASLENSLAERVTLWARANDQAPPSISNGADLLTAKETLVEMQMQAEAARRAAPTLAAEMDRALARRTALEETIKQRLVLDVLIDEADAIGATIAEHERLIAAEVAKLAAMRRPVARLVGFQSKPVNALNLLIGERRFDESEARALEARFQQLADALIGDASATLEGA
jgi:hypothetical protein